MKKLFGLLFLAMLPAAALADCPAQFQTEEFVHRTIVNPMFTILIPRDDTCQGKTGLAFNTTGLVISVRQDNESVAAVYAQSSSKIETIATLGTYAAPSATDKIRFREVDSSNQPGVYEIQPSRALIIPNRRRLDVCVKGSGFAETCMKVHVINTSGSCH